MVTAQSKGMATGTVGGDVQERLAWGEGVCPFRLQLPAAWELSDEALSRLGSANELLRFEVDEEGCLLIMAPSFPMSEARGALILAQLVAWTKRRGDGITVGSSAMFRLPDNSVRLPDAAWTSSARIEAMGTDVEGNWRTCPDFVVEVRSLTDDLDRLQEKMEMWVSQGAREAWLVDAYERVLWIYRPGRAPLRIERPDSATASEIADDLTIDLTDVWPSGEISDEVG